MNLEQLKDNASCSAQVFEACQVKRNKKWAKYLILDVSKRDMILERLMKVTIDIAKQAFEMFCDMKLEGAY